MAEAWGDTQSGCATQAVAKRRVGGPEWAGGHGMLIFAQWHSSRQRQRHVGPKQAKRRRARVGSRPWEAYLCITWLACGPCGMSELPASPCLCFHRLLRQIINSPVLHRLWLLLDIVGPCNLATSVAGHAHPPLG